MVSYEVENEIISHELFQALGDKSLIAFRQVLVSLSSQPFTYHAGGIYILCYERQAVIENIDKKHPYIPTY